MKNAAHETQAAWIMLRLIELHVERVGQIFLIYTDHTHLF